MKIIPGIIFLSCGLACSPCLRAQELFSSSLDSATGWTVVQEPAGTNSPSSLATFGFDYSTFGIPASPNGGGTTTGLRLAANALGTVQAITAATENSFSGNFRVTFDFWGNTVGPLPGGGTGATEYIGGGVGFSGITPRAGASLLTTVDGNSAGVDWRLDKAATAQTIASLQYNPAILSRDNLDPFFSSAFPGNTPPANQTTLFPTQTGTTHNGVVSFKWYTMQIDVDSAVGTAAFSVINPTSGTSSLIGTLNQSGTAVTTAGSGSLTLLDSFGGSISNSSLPADLVFAVFDNYKVTAIPEPGLAGLVGLSALALFRRRRRRL